MCYCLRLHDNIAGTFDCLIYMSSMYMGLPGPNQPHSSTHHPYPLRISFLTLCLIYLFLSLTSVLARGGCRGHCVGHVSDGGEEPVFVSVVESKWDDVDNRLCRGYIPPSQSFPPAGWQRATKYTIPGGPEGKSLSRFGRFWVLPALPGLPRPP